MKIHSYLYFIRYLQNISITLFGIFIFLFNVNTLAVDNDMDFENIPYYEDEGRLTFKFKGFIADASGKQTGLNPTVANSVSVGSLIKSGYGIEAATVIFFTDHIASELSLGGSSFKVKNSIVKNVAINYGISPNSVQTKSKTMYVVPITFILQYHIAPFGAIRPYLGAGYHWSYVLSKSKNFKTNNSHGPALQAGVELFAKDDTFMDLSIKQYILKTDIKYTSSIMGNNNIRSKIKMNPLIFAVGIGWKL